MPRMNTRQETYHSILLKSLYRTLYKELLGLNTETVALSKATRLLIELNKSNNSYKEALVGLDTLSLLLKNFQPTRINSFLAILSECSLKDIEKHSSFLQPYENEVLKAFEQFTLVKDIYLKNDLDDPIKVAGLHSTFYENKDVANVALIKYLQATNKVSYFTEVGKNSFCYISKNMLIPLSHQLQLTDLKTKFEDSCMEIEKPNEYIRVLKGMMQQLDQMKHLYMKQFCKGLSKKLKALGTSVKFTYRLKGALSIWNKLESQNLIQEELHDYLGVRAIIDATKENEIELCNKAYEIIKACYKVDHSKTRHWLLEPKESGYQALHVTVIAGPRTLVEIQIKSQNMHKVAETGPAAHWLYKRDFKGADSKLQKMIIEELKETLRLDD